MAQFTYDIVPGVTGVITAEGALADVYRRDATYTEVVDAAEVEDLKGKALDKALHDAGLPTSGSAADKRARLADAAAAHQPPAGFDKAQIAAQAQTAVVEDFDTAAAQPNTPGAPADRDAQTEEK
jgi:hypothetical protein